MFSKAKNEIGRLKIALTTVTREKETAIQEICSTDTNTASFDYRVWDKSRRDKQSSSRVGAGVQRIKKWKGETGARNQEFDKTQPGTRSQNLVDGNPSSKGNKNNNKNKCT